MRGFADSIKRVKKMVDINFYRINKEDKTTRRKAKARVQREGNGNTFFIVSEEGRRLFLEPDNIEGEELSERDKKELLKLGDWLESQALRNIEAAESFNLGRLCMYILIKAKLESDTDFLNWWKSYQFTISKYVYNYQNGYRNLKKLVG